MPCNSTNSSKISGISATGARWIRIRYSSISFSFWSTFSLMFWFIYNSMNKMRTGWEDFRYNPSESSVLLWWCSCFIDLQVSSGCRIKSHLLSTLFSWLSERLSTLWSSFWWLLFAWAILFILLGRISKILGSLAVMRSLTYLTLTFWDLSCLLPS